MIKIAIEKLRLDFMEKNSASKVQMLAEEDSSAALHYLSDAIYAKRTHNNMYNAKSLPLNF
ncbi:MAG: hypothetical protein ACI97K_000444 [Glaciecola sp.]|jgi:hypothetical protein